MVFWIGILIAALFAYSAVKLGFYQAWTMLFNVLIGVYVGIKLGPVVEEFVPWDSAYASALAVLTTGVGTFVILQGIAYVSLIGQFVVTFPRGINTLGSALVGFLAGFLIWSFVAFVICTTPFCENKFVKDIGFGAKNFEEAPMQSYLVWWCNFVDGITVSGDSERGVEQTIKDLLAKPATSSIKDKTDRPAPRRDVAKLEPNEPNGPNRPAEEPKHDSHLIIPP